MFIKVAVRELEPITLVWLRITLAAAVLVPAALAVVGRDALRQTRAAAGRLTVMGIVNSAIPFTLLAWAETRLDSGLAAILTAPFGIANLPGSMPGWKETGSVLLLGLVGTGVAYMLFFDLLRGAGASRSILVTYLVPSAALLYGVILLGEPVRATAVVGLALILGGVALGARRRRVASPA